MIKYCLICIMTFAVNISLSQNVLEVFTHKAIERKDCDVKKSQVIIYADSTFIFKGTYCKQWFNYDKKKWRKGKYFVGSGTWRIDNNSYNFYEKGVEGEYLVHNVSLGTIVMGSNIVLKSKSKNKKKSR